MTRPRRTLDERQRHQAAAARLYSLGVSQMEIARRLGLPRVTVTRDLATARRQLVDEALVETDHARGRELLRIKWLERELGQAWEDSGGTDPAIIQALVDCARLRCQLLGLFPPAPTDRPDPPKGERDGVLGALGAMMTAGD